MNPAPATTTATQLPNPINIPKPNTEEEFENYVAGTIGRFYVRIGDDGKPDKAFKDFVYSVAEPNGVFKEMFGWGNEAEFTIKIRIVKRDKNKLVTKQVNNVEVKEFDYIPKHRWNGKNWVINDADGEHVLAVGDFEKKFRVAE